MNSKVVMSIIVASLVNLAFFMGTRAGLNRIDGMQSEVKQDLHELMLGHAQAHAAKRGIKWSEERELANVAAVADYNSVPVGMIWPFRKWENGADLYEWGQIVSAGSVKALFWPTKQQSWQAGRTIRNAYPWFTLKHADAISANLKERGLKPGIQMELLLEDQDMRELFVGYVVNQAWKARARRKSQTAFILKQWEKWDTERGAP